MPNDVSDIARRLSAEALAVCAYYLCNGRREGRYWRCGDIRNTPGRSLFVRLTGPAHGPGAAGKWTDAATGEHGDLLDMIHLATGAPDFSVTLGEARTFLALPRQARSPPARPGGPLSAPSERARRLFQVSIPIHGTCAAQYLAGRGIRFVSSSGFLRFQPECYFRAGDNAALERWPALIAAVRDPAGHLVAVHRTYLSRCGFGKAPFGEPRRALGPLLGNAVRLAAIDDVAVAGEGIETILSVLTVLPALPAMAALSANHLAALTLPASVRRLYIAPDRDRDGFAAANRLEDRAREAGVEVVRLDCRLKDWNHDLCEDGHAVTLARAVRQLCPEDRSRYRPEALTLCR